MDSIVQRADAWVVSLVFAIGMVASWGLGFRSGRRSQGEPGEDPGTKFIDASLALLGLLLAFTFSMSLGRHDQRRLTVVAESNAIGDFYTCASLLKDPHRSKLQDVIREYAQFLLKTPQDGLTDGDEKKAKERYQKMFADMTGIVAEALAAGTPIAVSLTNTLNEVTSANASRLAAYRERLPWSIVLLLFLSCIVPAYLIGEKQGASRLVHLSGTLAFILLVTLVIFVTLDLNQPGRGLIRVSQESLEILTQSMTR